MTIEIPRDVYGLLKLEARRSQCSMKTLILQYLKKGLTQPDTGRRVRFPLIRGIGKTIDLTNEQIDAP